jgi:ribosomal protein L16 Arg81 hydroxylase
VLIFQVSGTKEVYLWPPGDCQGHYPFPVNHACDRQGMVNPDSPDLARFPAFATVRPHHAELEKGDLLYLPAAWWHHFRNTSHLACSITFWSKQQKANLKDITLPLSTRQAVTVQHNLEDMVLSVHDTERTDRTTTRIFCCIQFTLYSPNHRLHVFP